MLGGVAVGLVGFWWASGGLGVPFGGLAVGLVVLVGFWWAWCFLWWACGGLGGLLVGLMFSLVGLRGAFWLLVGSFVGLGVGLVGFWWA